jgi:uncharacterized protein YndB with AHSA1/START domain
MGAFELSREIVREPEAVWSVLSDVQRTPEWYSAVERVTPLGATTVGVGARFEFVRALPGGRAVNVVEVTECSPFERFAMSSLTGPTPFTYRYSTAPSASGTLLTLTGDISAEGLPGAAALLGPLATTLFKNGMRTNLEVFARLVELA